MHSKTEVSVSLTEFRKAEEAEGILRLFSKKKRLMTLDGLFKN